MSTYASCECGWAGGPYRTPGLASLATGRHSCERQAALNAAAEARARKEAATDRTPRPCHHKRAHHEHGTHTTYVLDHCRCLPCTRANAAYERARSRAKLYGRWDNYVDAGPAREHVEALRRSGLGMKTIAEQSGVSHGALTALVYGKNGRPPSRRLSKPVSDRLLAYLGGPLPDRANIDPTGTCRRLRALMALGWTTVRLADQLGRTAATVRRITDGRERVSAGTERAVRDLYDRLWDQAPPTDARGQKSAAERTRRHAAHLGWAPPLAWDDETIDNPVAQPQGVGTVADYHVDLARREAAVAQYARLGHSDKEIADILGITSRTALRIRQRLGIESRWVA